MFKYSAFDVLMLGSIPTAVNQCEEGTHDCEQICLDNGATFTCTCNSGYNLARDGRSCEGELLSLYRACMVSACASSMD